MLDQTDHVVAKSPIFDLCSHSDSAVTPSEKSSINTTRQPAITPKRYEIRCQLLLITNRKSHMGFRFIPTSITLNDLGRRNSPYFAFSSPNSTDYPADYITVVEDRPIMSENVVSQFQFQLLAKTITHPAARSLCDIFQICCSFRKWWLGSIIEAYFSTV